MSLTKEEFLKVVDQCIEEEGIKFLAIGVEGVGTEQEIIINPRVNFEEKKAYYDKTYDDNMVHKFSPNIKITYVAGWSHLSFYEGL